MSARPLAFAVILLAFASNTLAAETARQIVDRRKVLNNTRYHWTDRYQRMQIEIVDERGRLRTRELELFERRYPADARKAIVFFHAPSEVKGTGFLAFTPVTGPADQWIYLPAYKRVRKITAATRDEKFVGTDFTYRDMDLLGDHIYSWSEEEASTNLRGEETIEGVVCHVVEMTPHRKDIGYKWIVLWLGRDDLMGRRIEFYEGSDGGWLGGLLGEGGPAGVPKKRIRQLDVRMVGGIPVAYQVEVKTLSAGTQTTVQVTDVRFDQGLEDDLFTQRYLERGGR